MDELSIDKSIYIASMEVQIDSQLFKLLFLKRITK